LEVHAKGKVSLPLRHIAFAQVFSTLEPVKVASYDETSFELHMGLKPGYSFCGTRAIVKRRRQPTGKKVTLAICVSMLPRPEFNNGKGGCVVEACLHSIIIAFWVWVVRLLIPL
jgi:hypothetical protein